MSAPSLESAARQALEALTNCTSKYGHRCNRCDDEVDEGGRVAAALRAALAQPATVAQDRIDAERWRTIRRMLSAGDLDYLTLEGEPESVIEAAMDAARRSG